MCEIPSYQARGSAGEVGLAQFQEGRLHNATTSSCHPRRDASHRLIGAFNARAVSEHDEPGHTWISEGASAGPACFCGK
jgi:hypothetical protein